MLLCMGGLQHAATRDEKLRILPHCTKGPLPCTPSWYLKRVTSNYSTWAALIRVIGRVGGDTDMSATRSVDAHSSRDNWACYSLRRFQILSILYFFFHDKFWLRVYPTYICLHSRFQTLVLAEDAVQPSIYCVRFSHTPKLCSLCASASHLSRVRRCERRRCTMRRLLWY